MAASNNQEIDVNRLIALEQLTAAKGLAPSGPAESFYGLLKSTQQAKPIINICEYLLESMAGIEGEKLQQTIQASGFWFKLGLNYFKEESPDQMDRQLILLGLHYASQGETKTAEYIYLEAIHKLEREENRCFSLVMAKNLYARMLLRDKQRQEEAYMHLQQADSLARNLPFWWDSLEHVIISDFDIHQ